MKSVQKGTTLWDIKSSSVRGCGLKLFLAWCDEYVAMSSSVRGCGLKCYERQDIYISYNVILCARMWIEIPRHGRGFAMVEGHPLCEDVD